MFSLRELPLESLPLELKDPGAGALVTFEGRVRNLNEGQEVVSLEYEAYAELAETEGNRIVEEALGRFAISAAEAVHRVGHLAIGEAAIRVAVIAPHRREAFRACEWIVDTVKATVPIWKREHYANGPTEWLCPAASGASEDNYYSRQMKLPEIGTEGQQRLREAKVLVVGAGGLGSSALTYLAAAGVGHIRICDGDLLDESNLHRQPLYSHEMLGANKADFAAERLRSLNPYIQVDSLPEFCTPGNVAELTKWCDVVLDCTDNFETKFLLSDSATRAGKALVQASIYQYEGQLFVQQLGGACLRCMWSEVPEASCVGSCAEVGVLGFVPGVFGTLQAAETIKLILGMKTLESELILFNLLDYSLLRIDAPKNTDCQCSVPTASIDPGVPWQRWINNESDLKSYTLIDIRREDEFARTPIKYDHDRIQFEYFDPGRLKGNKPFLLVCAHGVRSEALAHALHDQGRSDIYSLVGGIARMPTLVRP
jgi:adenylyltransferase/sulfurtransferase